MAYDYTLYTTSDRPSTEMSVYQCGWECCYPGHFYGPAIRDHYLIHYVIKGRGEYIVNKKNYQLSKGDGFLICPSISTTYRACPDDPWEYYWVGFNGTQAKRLLKLANLDLDHPIFRYDRDDFLESCLIKMYNETRSASSIDIATLGYLYLFISKLVQQHASTLKQKSRGANDYISKAIRYIQDNYSRNIEIGQIAAYVGIDRTQLFRSFKLKMDISPQRYLINYRIAKACEIMRTTDYSIEEIAYSVGFEYLSYFFKAFKRETKTTPSLYRKKPFEHDTDINQKV